METRLMVAEAKVATNPELLAAAGGKRKADDQGENPVVVPQPVAKDSPDGPPLEASEAPTFQEGGSSSSGTVAPDQNMSADDAAQVSQVCSIVHSLRVLGADTHETIYDISQCVYLSLIHI